MKIGDKYICIKEFSGIKINHILFYYMILTKTEEHGLFFSYKNNLVFLTLEEYKEYLISIEKFRENRLNKIIND